MGARKRRGPGPTTFRQRSAPGLLPLLRPVHPASQSVARTPSAIAAQITPKPILLRRLLLHRRPSVQIVLKNIAHPAEQDRLSSPGSDTSSVASSARNNTTQAVANADLSLSRQVRRLTVLAHARLRGSRLEPCSATPRAQARVLNLRRCPHRPARSRCRPAPAAIE